MNEEIISVKPSNITNDSFKKESENYSPEKEFRNIILKKLMNKEAIFEMVKNEKRVSIKQSETDEQGIERKSEISVKDDDVIFKPKSIRATPGYNATSGGNIIINNVVNIYNQNISDPAAVAIVTQNLSQFKEGENNVININVIGQNIETGITKVKGIIIYL